jgi:hypothetical protein
LGGRKRGVKSEAGKKEKRKLEKEGEMKKEENEGGSGESPNLIRGPPAWSVCRARFFSRAFGLAAFSLARAIGALKALDRAAAAAVPACYVVHPVEPGIPARGHAGDGTIFGNDRLPALIFIFKPGANRFGTLCLAADVVAVQVRRGYAKAVAAHLIPVAVGIFFALFSILLLDYVVSAVGFGNAVGIKEALIVTRTLYQHALFLDALVVGFYAIRIKEALVLPGTFYLNAFFFNAFEMVFDAV